MPLSELPQSTLFIIFLLLFVLIGIYPIWKKTARVLRSTLRKAEQTHQSGRDQSTSQTPDVNMEELPKAHLSDFEIFILRRMAQESDKSLSRQQINANLHFEPAVLKPALKSLLQRGLLAVNFGYLSGIRYHLSASGRIYAIDRGLIPSIHDQTH